MPCRKPNAAARPMPSSCRGMPIESLLLVRLLNDLQHLFVVMAVNSVVPFFADHQFCARRPPFSQETSISDLPMMPFICYPQRQSPLLTPPANVGLFLQIRA